MLRLIVEIAPHPQCRISSFLHQHRYSLKCRCDEFRAQSLGHRSLQRSPDPAPPSLHGILWGEFSRFVGITQCSDSLPSFRPHFVAFAWPYRAGLALRSPARTSHLPGSWRLITRSPSGILRGDDWVSQVPGGPPVRTPCSPTPAGRDAPRQNGRLARPSLSNNTPAPATNCISGLYHTAYALAVYASQRGSPLRHARLASGWWLASTGWGSIPTGTLGRFLTCLHAIPLPQALPGAHSSPVRLA